MIHTGSPYVIQGIIKTGTKTTEDEPPSLSDVLALVASAWPDDQAFTTTSPIQFTTSDGATITIEVQTQ